MRVRWCVCVCWLAAALQATVGLELNTGVTCEIPVEILANTHMCFWSRIEPEVVDYQLVEEEVQVLTRPCDTCFPEVKTVTMSIEKPVFSDVCTLKQFWRRPRGIRMTTAGVRILATPGLLMDRNYPSGVVCVWRVECSEGEKIYFNASTHSTQGLDQSETELCPDYVQVLLGNTTLESCGQVPHQMLVNQVQGNSLDVVFRSDQHTTAQGLRLDTTCFQPSAERGGATGENVIEGIMDSSRPPHPVLSSDTDDCTMIGDLPSGPESVPNEAEQALIQRVFQLHFDLFSATDACARGVQRCVRIDFGHLATSIAETLDAITPYKNACNPLVRSLVARTLELLQD